MRLIVWWGWSRGGRSDWAVVVHLTDSSRKANRSGYDFFTRLHLLIADNPKNDVPLRSVFQYNNNMYNAYTIFVVFIPLIIKFQQ